MRLQAIPVDYRGVTFRSTLEGDWAKNLDAMNLVWEYEPEGVKLSNRQNYRCDFYLPRVTTWMEVKGPHDERIDKPGQLQDDCLHAPGCESGSPGQVFAGPSNSSCACRFGPEFPWRLVVVARSANSGKLTFEASHSALAPDQDIVILRCPVCNQYSFTDVSRGARACRRCHQDATGGAIIRTGRRPFLRIEPPVPRGRGRRAPAKKRAR